MMQFLADQIDQMDLALDQLSMKDRNFDRFALMLIDNVVELCLHNYAKDRSFENDLWNRTPPPKSLKLVSEALGQRFDAKVKLARINNFIPETVCDSIQYLHSFRNTAYHRGLRHDGILHSLALFYFKNACITLINYSPIVFSSGSGDQISHRATKYLGRTGLLARPNFTSVWERLRDVADSMGDTLILDLHSDMSETINRTDSALDFLADYKQSSDTNRKSVVIDSQAWVFALSDAGKKYARENNAPFSSLKVYIEWFASNYSWPVSADPIPGWRKRLDSLAEEKNPNTALKKYCDFLSQTQEIRSIISDAESRLDAHIQNLFDESRDK